MQTGIPLSGFYNTVGILTNPVDALREFFKRLFPTASPAEIEKAVQITQQLDKQNTGGGSVNSTGGGGGRQQQKRTASSVQSGGSTNLLPPTIMGGGAQQVRGSGGAQGTTTAGNAQAAKKAQQQQKRLAALATKNVQQQQKRLAAPAASFVPNAPDQKRQDQGGQSGVGGASALQGRAAAMLNTSGQGQRSTQPENVIPKTPQQFQAQGQGQRGLGGGAQVVNTITKTPQQLKAQQDRKAAQAAAKAQQDQRRAAQGVKMGEEDRLSAEAQAVAKAKAIVQQIRNIASQATTVSQMTKVQVENFEKPPLTSKGVGLKANNLKTRLPKIAELLKRMQAAAENARGKKGLLDTTYENQPQLIQTASTYIGTIESAITNLTQYIERLQNTLQKLEKSKIPLQSSRPLSSKAGGGGERGGRLKLLQDKRTTKANAIAKLKQSAATAEIKAVTAKEAKKLQQQRTTAKAKQERQKKQADRVAKQASGKAQQQERPKAAQELRVKSLQDLSSLIPPTPSTTGGGGGGGGNGTPQFTYFSSIPVGTGGGSQTLPNPTTPRRSNPGLTGLPTPQRYNNT